MKARNKQCVRCMNMFPQTAFTFQNKSKGVRYDRCKECLSVPYPPVKLPDETREPMTELAHIWTEREFTKHVINLAHQNGWMAAHFKAAVMPSGRWATPVQGDGKGFPDTLMVKEPFDMPSFNTKTLEVKKMVKEAGSSFVFPVQPVNMRNVIAAELKVSNGDISSEQITWLLAFSSVGIPAFVWTPNDMHEIRKRLKGDH